MCDSDRNASRVERKNTETLGFTDRAELFCCDWRQAVRKLAERGLRFDLIFLDPPYRMTDLREVFEGIAPLLTADGLVIVEHEAGESFLYGDGFTVTDERKWGFCGMSFLRKSGSEPQCEKPEEET
jgi:16S rRNA G966 N2-methylase RsmD